MKRKELKMDKVDRVISVDVKKKPVSKQRNSTNDET